MSQWIWEHLDITIAILAGCILVLLVLCIVLFVKIERQKKRYTFFMGANRRPSHNLEQKIEKYYKTSQEIESHYSKLLDMVTDLDKTMKSNIQKVGLVRYNPFEEMGGNLCFTLALLDGKDNGVVLNGIHSRTGSFTYAKPIEMGVSIYMLSAEEIQAVEMAKQNAYQPEHEKVVKVKFKPSFRKRDKEEIMEDQIPLELDEIKSEKADIGDVTAAEKEQILAEESIARSIAAADIQETAQTDEITDTPQETEYSEETKTEAAEEIEPAAQEETELSERKSEEI